MDQTVNSKRVALERAVEVAGGQTALAKAVSEISGKDVKQGHIWAWVNRYGIPAEFVIPVATVVNQEVTCHDLRPDIYPPEAAA